MNTLTDLIPDLYRAMDVVSRELTGFIPAVTLDAEASRAAVGQPVRVPVTPAAQAENITPGTNPPDTGDQTIGNRNITITKSRAVPFRWTGEEQRGVNSGPGYLSIRQNQMAQAMRTLANEVEADLGGLYVRASRSRGEAGTTPFGTSQGIKDAAQVLQILEDNGAPSSDLHMVINSTAAVNMRSLDNLYKANEAGNDELLRQGIMGDLHGMAIRSSAGVKRHTAGTGSAYVTNGTAAAGDIEVDIDTGNGTVLAGDIVTFADYENEGHVVSAFGGGTLTLNEPGAYGAIGDGVDVTLAANYAANMIFHRNAMVLAARAPALPEEGDSADDRMLITDPRTGLTFEVAMYREYRRVRYEIGLSWGVANIKPEHTALLLG